MPLTLRHHIAVSDPLGHLVDVETVVESSENMTGPITLFMPVWTPGSYLVREYSRHVEGFAGPGARKVRKNAWRVDAAGDKTLTVRYRLYCNELTVRTNHVDGTHALLNGAATFLAVEGHENAPATIAIRTPNARWRVATPLKAVGEGVYEAPDLDALADGPIAAGEVDDAAFEVLGTPHELIVWPKGRVSDVDRARLVADTRSIVQAIAHRFDGTLPYDRYLFLLHVAPRGRGGLEHRSCCTLIASPAAFTTRAAYVDLLTLFAHEAFHAWNVKRIRPEGLTPYRYQEENYTRLLWWFEGATSYYDWLTVRAAKLCTIDEYLEHLGSEIGQLEATHGRLVHSLEEASFDAWIKLYRPDENSPNSSVSYYRKGEVVCALFDLELRGRTGGAVTLETVLRYLWRTYGVAEQPVPEGAMQEIFERVSGLPLGDLFDAWVRSPSPIDYGPTLARAGLKLERAREPGEAKNGVKAALGIKTRTEGARVIVAQVPRGGAGHRAGLDASDELVAIGGKRVEAGGLDAALAGHSPGESIEVVVAREGRLVSRTVLLEELRSDRAKLVARPEASAAERAIFAAWMGDEHPAWSKKA